MEARPLLFWHASAATQLSSQEIARELLWGEEVEGLVDLPIRKILDRLASEFAEHEERSGVFKAQAGGGSLEATWTWQHLRVDVRDMAPQERERLIDIVESFGCMAYAAQA